MINLAIVDDHNMFRQGIAAVVDKFPGIQVSLQSENGQEFLKQLENTKVDIALLDMEMPVLNGIETLEKLQQLSSEIKVIIVSSNKEQNLICSLMELGAKGYLLKEADTEELKRAIFSVVETGFYFNDVVSQALLIKLAAKEEIQPTFNGGEQISNREREILQLICSELTTLEIAEKLVLSPRTIENHRTRIMDKTGVRNTAGLVVYALKNDLVHVG